MCISDGLLISAKEIKILQDFYKAHGKEFNALRVVPTVNNRTYKFNGPNYISIAGTTKDTKRGASRFIAALESLNKAKVLKAYGDWHSYKAVPEAYQGSIHDPEEFISTLNRNGIVLVVHRSDHFNNGIPTNRIMEAAAANTLIISDQNPFVIEEFGDSVLYFDAAADSETISEQILDHYRWAQNNPIEAEALAAKAHKIFHAKFTAEKDLKRIAQMHEKILAD
jgi:spore maturation protein CgeB